MYVHRHLALGESVVASSPPRWPLTKLPDGDVPGCSGMRPRRSGSWKVVTPLPPKLTPSSENKAWFCAMGSIWPLQKAHPLGG